MGDTRKEGAGGWHRPLDSCVIKNAVPSALIDNPSPGSQERALSPTPFSSGNGFLLFPFPATFNCSLHRAKAALGSEAMVLMSDNTGDRPVRKMAEVPIFINAAYSALLYSFQYPNLHLISAAFNRKHLWSLDKATSLDLNICK